MDYLQRICVIVSMHWYSTLMKAFFTLTSCRKNFQTENKKYGKDSEVTTSVLNVKDYFRYVSHIYIKYAAQLASAIDPLFQQASCPTQNLIEQRLADLVRVLSR